MIFCSTHHQRSFLLPQIGTDAETHSQILRGERSLDTQLLMGCLHKILPTRAQGTQQKGDRKSVKVEGNGRHQESKASESNKTE